MARLEPDQRSGDLLNRAINDTDDELRDLRADLAELRDRVETIMGELGERDGSPPPASPTPAPTPPRPMGALRGQTVNSGRTQEEDGAEWSNRIRRGPYENGDFVRDRGDGWVEVWSARLNGVTTMTHAQWRLSHREKAEAWLREHYPESVQDEDSP